jgi:hypothetical protein
MKPLPLAAAACALALGGCSSIRPLPGSPSAAQAAPATAMDGEKALDLAHLAYQAAGVALRQAAQSGALRGSDAAEAQALFDRAGAALDIADRADAAGDPQGAAASVADAESAISRIEALVGK